MIKSLITIFLALILNAAVAQENYEIQVYASPTQKQGSTIFELHSNFTFRGEKNIINGVHPSHHALHETVEITHGVGENFEVGFYIFTNYTSPYGYHLVGTHVRPRIRVPEKWKWPVGVSLSTEIGYQSRQYSTDTWSIEIRPIIDKQIDNFYIAFNPTFSIGLSNNNDHTPAFEPNIKTSYALNKVAVGVEYYGSIGQLDQIPKISSQGHALFAVADLTIDPRWEINFGPGWGLTNATDKFVFKLLLGRRITWQKQKHKV
ncbi:MAG: hypothetical protein ABIN94_19750 [Ferruginibacter sp.]